MANTIKMTNTTKMNLRRFPVNQPDYEAFDEMMSGLMGVLDSPAAAKATDSPAAAKATGSPAAAAAAKPAVAGVNGTAETAAAYAAAVREIMDFQDEDGSFRFLDSYELPSDCRVDFCHMPTYVCTAILIKAFLTDPALLEGREQEIFPKALKACCVRGLRGHGYEAEEKRREVQEILDRAGMREFIFANPDFAGYLTEEVRAQFPGVHVFTYGTLMRGRSNHNAFMADCTYLGDASAEGYDMYDVGHFPAAVRGKGTIKGELYLAPLTAIDSLDCLEGEGTLYSRKIIPVQPKTGAELPKVGAREAGPAEKVQPKTGAVQTKTGTREAEPAEKLQPEADGTYFAIFYEFLGDTRGMEPIPEDCQPYTADRKEVAGR